MYAANHPQRWDSIALAQPMDTQKRGKIRANTASLLDFRNYLFLRQSTLLFLLLRPWQVSQRAIQFMQNCLQELSMLEVKTGARLQNCCVSNVTRDHVMTRDLVLFTAGAAGRSIGVLGLSDVPRNTANV